jgi:hypothetical protein
MASFPVAPTRSERPIGYAEMLTPGTLHGDGEKRQGK